MSEICICFSCDNNFTSHLAVAITSILYNSAKDDNLFFFVIDGGITEKNKSKIVSLKKIKNFYIEFLFVKNCDFATCKQTEQAKHISIATYYRFKIPSLLAQYDKVLYLDCDIIVQSSLSELWNTDITNYYLAAVPDLYDISNMERLKLNNCYINAGVMLINNKLWIFDEIENELFDYTKNNASSIVWQDQDVINIILQEKIKLLAVNYNYQYGINYNVNEKVKYPEYFVSPLSNPTIIHFIGDDKPWKLKSKSIYRKLYWSYVLLTPWKKIYFSYRLKYLYAYYKDRCIDFIKYILRKK